MNKYINTKHIKRGILLIALLFITFELLAQTREPVYISPNNDGVQDELTIPLSIRERRYVSEWALVIEDSNNNVVRTVGNKVALPEDLNFFSFFRQLFAPKEGVAIPSEVVWNGVFDSGEVAPDGTYTYFVRATDDNGNESRTSSYTVIVDNTAPVVSLRQPSESAKIFGGSNREEIVISQDGSQEDLWTGQILDNKGTVVRTYTWENSSPQQFEWDGKTDTNVAVEQGVYSYRIVSKDRAGNINQSAQVTNIIFDAVPRAVNMMVQGSPFSPNGDGVQDEIAILPSMSTTSGLINWKIEINTLSGQNVVSFDGTDAPPQSIPFDGVDKNGKTLQDGNYRLTFTALFSNGQESIINRNITVDTVEPVAQVQSDKTIFSPDGDGRLDTLVISQSGSKEKSWLGEIVNEAGQTIRTWEFGEEPTQTVEWNGLSDDGQVVDGFYKYVLSSTDLAGNTKEVMTTAIELNTGTTEVILTVSPDAFSPNADGVQDILNFSPIIRTDTGIADYSLIILDNRGKTVKTYSANRSLPRTLSWDGLSDDGSKVSDGTYTAELTATSNNGSQTKVTTQSFVLDTVYPEVALKSDYTLFSPNEDGNKDNVLLDIETSSEELWTGTIRSKQTNEIVRSYSWIGKANSFEWDGSDEAGNIALDGEYTFTLASTDAAGNKAEKVIQDLEIDNRQATLFVTLENEAFSPNNDNVLDNQVFAIRASVPDGAASWQLNLINSATNRSVRQWRDDGTGIIPKEIQWDGKDASGKILEGVFTANIFIEYEKGDEIEVTTSEFISSITPPKLAIQTAPEYFSPDNDGIDDDMFIGLQGESAVPFSSWSFEINDPENGKRFWSTSGNTSITERIIWDGRSNTGELVQSAVDYPYVFTVTDSIGMTSTIEGVIPIDVLVIRVGDVLKMQVPSIIFRSDNADFVGRNQDPVRGLSPSVVANNERVLKRIAEILNKFKDYNVTIEGHANNVSGTEEEETSTENGNIPLVPLSEDRAEFVKDKLVEYGISESRLSTVGVGGRVRIADLDDRENWWKNRRVEFILEK